MMKKALIVLIALSCASLGCTTASAQAGEDPATPTTRPSKDFVAEYIRAKKKGYIERPCGFDMNRNGVLGEPADRLVGDGKTKDPDGDGVNEDILYVDAKAGSDETGDGSSTRPFKTIQKALDICDGPEDGAEDIICISGVFHETLRISASGVVGHYLRDGFQFPKNPLMIVGWDKDGDGKYPPHDKDDEAVLDGLGESKENHLHHGIRTERADAPSYLEIAHLTIRNYGYNWGNDPPSEGRSFGAFRFTGGSKERPQTHIYVHDVKMDVLAGFASTSGWIAFNWFGGYRHHWALVNNYVRYGSYAIRGSGLGEHFRVQNNTFSGLGVVGGDRRQPNSNRTRLSGMKIWGLNSRWAILDNVFKVEVRSPKWNKPPTYGANAVLVGQCSQDWVIRGNVFDNHGSAVHLQGSAGPRACPDRSVDNIHIEGNLIRIDYPWRASGGIGVGNTEVATNTVANFSVVNNIIFVDTRKDPNVRMDSAVRPSIAPTDQENPGAVTIAGNTFYGPFRTAAIDATSYQARRNPKLYRQQDWVIKNNIFANSGDARNLSFDFKPSNFLVNGNVYSGSGGWLWGGKRISTFSDWREATGEDADSRVGKPKFRNPVSGDLHLTPADTVAKGAGVDITDITKVDFDGHPRSATQPGPGADVPGPKTTKRPLRAGINKD